MIHKKQTYIFVLRFLSVWWRYKGLFDAFAKLRKATVSFLVSVLRPFVCNNLAPAGQSFVKMYVGEFYSSRSSKVQFGYNQTKLTGTSHKDPRLFICGTTLAKSVTNTELQWLSWLPFFKQDYHYSLVSVIRERVKSCSLCGYFLSCCAL